MTLEESKVQVAGLVTLEHEVGVGLSDDQRAQVLCVSQTRLQACQGWKHISQHLQPYQHTNLW